MAGRDPKAPVGCKRRQNPGHLATSLAPIDVGEEFTGALDYRETGQQGTMCPV